MKLNITVDMSGAMRRLQALQQSVPRVISDALNATGADVERAIQAEIRTSVDSPRPITVRSTYRLRAKPTRLDTIIGIKDRQAEYLRPLIFGGARTYKGAEQRLGNRYFVPGPGVRLDRFGNVPKATLLAIFRAARKGGRYRGGSVVIGTPPGTTLQAGAWLMRRKAAPLPLLLFVDAAPTYRKTIEFYEVAERTARRQFPIHARAAIRAALARAGL